MGKRTVYDPDQVYVTGGIYDNGHSVQDDSPEPTIVFQTDQPTVRGIKPRKGGEVTRQDGVPGALGQFER